MLTARAGPQPYLLGEIYGCAAASGMQNSAGLSTSAQSFALTADLDWGIELRAEALAAEKSLGEKRLSLLSPRHLYFKDLAHSTALVPAVAGAAPVSLGKPASFHINMPSCYPYADQLEYQVKWTGGASGGMGAAITSGKLPSIAGVKPASTAVPASSSSACNVQPGQADCWGDPVKPISLDLVWPQAGSYGLSVTPVRDKHGRVFDSPASAQVPVRVQ
jgi:hypothetical protein